MHNIKTYRQRIDKNAGKMSKTGHKIIQMGDTKEKILCVQRPAFWGDFFVSCGFFPSCIKSFKHNLGF